MEILSTRVEWVGITEDRAWNQNFLLFFPPKWFAGDACTLQSFQESMVLQDYTWIQPITVPLTIVCLTI